MNHSEEDIESLRLTTTSEQRKYERIFILEDIKRILDDPKNDDDHEDILNWIKEKNLCLYSKEKDTGDSLIKILFQEVGNGHKLVEKVMDSYISATSSNPNSNHYSIKIDFTGLMLETDIEDDRKEAVRSGLAGKKSDDSVLDDILDIHLRESSFDRYPAYWLTQHGNQKAITGKVINLLIRSGVQQCQAQGLVFCP